MCWSNNARRFVNVCVMSVQVGVQSPAAVCADADDTLRPLRPTVPGISFSSAFINTPAFHKDIITSAFQKDITAFHCVLITAAFYNDIING